MPKSITHVNKSPLNSANNSILFTQEGRHFQLLHCLKELGWTICGVGGEELFRSQSGLEQQSQQVQLVTQLPCGGYQANLLLFIFQKSKYLSPSNKFEHLKLQLNTFTSLLSYQVYQWWECLTGELHIWVWGAVPAPLGLARSKQCLQNRPPAAKEWMKHSCRLYRGFPHTSTKENLPLIWISSQGVFLWWRTWTHTAGLAQMCHHRSGTCYQ